KLLLFADLAFHVDLLEVEVDALVCEELLVEEIHGGVEGGPAADALVEAGFALSLELLALFLGAEVVDRALVVEIPLRGGGFPGVEAGGFGCFFRSQGTGAQGGECEQDEEGTDGFHGSRMWFEVFSGASPLGRNGVRDLSLE